MTTGTLLNEVVETGLPESLMGHRLGGTIYRDRYGRYNWKGWGPIPSVTSVIGSMNKPALVPWAAKCVAEAARAIAEDLVAGKLKGPEAIAKLRDTDTLKRAPDNARDSKADVGTTVHSVAEQMALGMTVDASVFAPDTQPYIRSFVRWYERVHPRICAVEAMCANRTWGYAGTFDTIMVVGGRVMVVDYKTSGDSYPEHALQLAAYRNAEFIGLQDGAELPMPSTDGGAILLIGPETCRLVEWECGEEQFNVFRSLIPVRNWSAKTRQLKGREISSTEGV